MARETELKFKVDDFRPVREALREAGAAYLGTRLQTDRYYDTAERRLRDGDIGLRVRRTEHIDGPEIDTRAQLTFKGPADGASRAKIREEVQTHVDQPAAIEQAFAALGLAVTLQVQKRRETYRLGPCLVELDELPILGCFIEIEAPDEAAIENVEAMLHVTSEAIRDHYVAMADRACRKLGDACRSLTFDGCERCDG